MEELIKYTVSNIIDSEDFEITSEEDADYVRYSIKAPEDMIGLIIGKGGKTIKSIRKLVKIRATLEKKRVDLEVISA